MKVIAAQAGQALHVLDRFHITSHLNKSDIYALGLVLYEIFTGNPAFGSATARHPLPRAPSSLVTDIDTAVDRVILQCLDSDPANRPHSAMAVAAALPGGDPLAAALAAGETPSPEMVALAGGTDRLPLRTAMVCLAAVMVGLVMAALVGSKVNLIERAHLSKPPEVLAQNASEWITRLGYKEPPADVPSTGCYILAPKEALLIVPSG